MAVRVTLDALIVAKGIKARDLAALHSHNFV